MMMDKAAYIHYRTELFPVGVQLLLHALYLAFVKGHAVVSIFLNIRPRSTNGQKDQDCFASSHS